VRGGLHKDNPFGHALNESVQTGERLWVKRKPLTELSASEVLQIRDSMIRDTVIAHLRDNEIEVKTIRPKKGRPKIEFSLLAGGEKLTPKKLAGILSNTKMRSGVPIKKVRLLIKNDTIQKIRDRKSQRANDPTQIAYVEPDYLHHACLFQWDENGKTKYDAVYVTRLEAARRQLNNESLIRRIHPNQSDAKFRFSICTGDLVLANVNGESKLMKVSTMVSTQKRIHLVDVNDARRSSQQPDIGLTPTTFLEKYGARKVVVDPLGRIRWANN
jgi:hypothetical protein